MSWAILIGCALVCFLAPGARSSADEVRPLRWTGHVDVAGGAKLFREGFWGPAHQDIGFRCELGPPRAPAHLAFGFLVSPRTLEFEKPKEADEFTRAQVGDVLGTTTVEMDLGLRSYVPRGKRFQYTFASGISLVYARFDYKASEPELGPMATSLRSDRDLGLGPWVSAGVFYVRDVPGWGFGGEVRFVTARVEHFGRRLEGGGVHIDATVGRAW